MISSKRDKGNFNQGDIEPVAATGKEWMQM
jgi:hypothetical protein